MKILILIFILATAKQALSIDITSHYFQQLTLRNKGLPKISAIVYGAESIGYFRTSSFRMGKAIQIYDFLPPTYIEPIKFFAEVKPGDKKVFLGERKFENPTPKAIASIQPFYESGKLTQNFLILSASIPMQYLKDLNAEEVKPDLEKKNGNRFTFLIAINKNLEIVWAYIPHRKEEPFYSYVSFRKIEKDKYGFVLGKKDGLYATINSKGTILQSIDGTLGEKKFPMHHDFTYLGDDRILTFGNRYAKLLDQHRKKKLFLSNTILELDLKRNKVRKAFDFLKFIRPLTVGYWHENKFKPRWVVWDNINADHDFVHANSIEYYKGKGILVSLKHVDKVLLVDEDMEKIIWSIGPTKKDTFQATGQNRFSHQHDAKFIGEDELILFDNGFTQRRSRAMALKIDRNTKRVETMWEFSPKPPLYAENRGGVVQLPDGLFMAHFVSPAGRKYNSKLTMDEDRIFIFDPVNKKIKCELVIPFRTRSAGFRSFPYDTIGNEDFLGKSPEGLQQGA